MLKKHKSRSIGTSFIGRIFRSLFTIFVLTAFIVFIALFIKGLSSASSEGSIFSRIFSKLPVKQMTQKSVDANTYEVKPVSESTSSNNKEIVATVALLSDSHNNLDNLTKALDIVKNRNIKTVFFLGDYTDLGVMTDLEAAKQVMDNSGLEYYCLPGDHDLWQSVGPDNFLKVFGKNYFVKELGGFKFVGLDNSANFTVIDSARMAWFKQNLANVDFVILSQPLYHPSFDVVMGVVNGEDVTNVKNQATDILDLIRNSNVRAIFAGDQHLSSENKDPVKGELQHIVVGALTKSRNLQTPRFSILSIEKNGDFSLEEVVLE